MTLSPITVGGVQVVEGEPAQPFMAAVKDASRLLEVCFSAHARAALLYPENLTPRFFDLSSAEAGQILQKLRGYHVRLAVVAAAGAVAFSTRFGQFLAHEQREGYFGVFETRDAALEWLGRTAPP